MLALLVLLFCAGSPRPARRRCGLREMKPKSQAGHELGRLLCPGGPSFFPDRGMNAFDRCHRNEEGGG